MQGVSAGLGYYVNHAANGASRFSRPAMLKNLKLLNAFISEILEKASDDIVFIIAAVHVDIKLSAIASAECDVADASLGRVERAYGSRFRQDG